MKIRSIKYAFALAVGLPLASAIPAYAQTAPQAAAGPAINTVQNADDANTDLVQKLLKQSVAIHINAPSEEEIASQAKEPPACRKLEPRSEGSGYVVDAQAGLIATNNHVIEGATKKIEVEFSDGEKRTATLVGADPETDIAIVKVDVNPEKPLSAVTFGDSDTMLEGRSIIAIGNPLGLGLTVTTGILSAKHRSLDESSPFDNYLQIDASINHGNSGGPLFNLKGELSGMNTAIASPGGGGSIGLGFAIPSDEIKSVIEQLRASTDGKLHYGMLGIGITSVDKETAIRAGMSEPRGILISKVFEDSAAKRAGLAEGDIIIALEGKPVTNITKLQGDVARLMAGHEAHLRYLRNGTEHEAIMILGERPSKENKAAEAEKNAPPLTPEEKEQAWEEFKNIPDPMKGMVLKQLPPKIQKEFMERYQTEACAEQRKELEQGTEVPSENPSEGIPQLQVIPNPNQGDHAFPPGFLESMTTKQFQQFLAHQYKEKAAAIQEQIRVMEEQLEKAEKEVDAEIDRRDAAPEVAPQPEQGKEQPSGSLQSAPPEVQELFRQMQRQLGPGPRAIPMPGGPKLQVLPLPAPGP